MFEILRDSDHIGFQMIRFRLFQIYLGHFMTFVQFILYRLIPLHQNIHHILLTGK